MNLDCIVVIPIYKEHLNNYEYVSVARCFKLLGLNYDICFLTYKELDLKEYIEISKKYKVSSNCIFYDKEYFKSNITYNLIMTDISFYNTFYTKGYKYIYIYQTDCYIFKNDLQFWIDRNEDQVECITHQCGFKHGNLQIFYNGEGLRKLDTFITVMYENADSINLIRSMFLSLIMIMNHPDWEENRLFTGKWFYYKSGEDLFFTKLISKGVINKQHYLFGYSDLKKMLYDTVGLPMMIHYWNKDDKVFKEIIGDPDIDRESCINKEF